MPTAGNASGFNPQASAAAVPLSKVPRLNGSRMYPAVKTVKQ